MSQKAIRRSRYPAKMFAAAASKSKMAETSIAMARAVLVDGKTMRETAAAHNRSPGWVNKAVRRMRDYLEADDPAPADWVERTIVLPETAWRQVRILEHEAWASIRKTSDRSYKSNKKK